MQPGVAPDGTVWFGEMGTNQLGRLDPKTGKVASWTPPGGAFGIMAVAPDATGTIWFTEQSASYIGRFEPATQTFRTYRLADAKGQAAAPQDLAVAPDGTVWFTEVSAGQIGRLDPASGTIRTWPVPATVPGAAVYPYGIALAPNGTVWFSELSNGTVGQLDPTSGAIRLYRAPTGDAEIFSHALSPAGAVWFTELQYHKLGVLDPSSGSVREITVPSPRSATPNLYDILVGTDGTVWVADMGQDAITRFVPRTATFTWFALPEPSSIPYGLAWDRSGRLWFTADRSPTNYVGMLAK